MNQALICFHTIVVKRFKAKIDGFYKLRQVMLDMTNLYIWHKNPNEGAFSQGGGGGPLYCKA